MGRLRRVARDRVTPNATVDLAVWSLSHPNISLLEYPLGFRSSLYYRSISCYWMIFTAAVY